VDANAIKLPTDGYQAPNDIQRIFGNMESDGRSGRDRPKPKEAPASQQATPPAPRVGDAAPAAGSNQPAVASAAPSAGKHAKADPSAQPGFSLK
jgi:pilus assembly protein CpaC